MKLLPFTPHLALAFLLGGLALAAGASAPAQAQTAPLEQAFSLYQEADFEAAADLLVVVAEDPGAPIVERKQALEMLGLIYVQQRREEEARAVMEQLLDLEPPLVEVDLDEIHPALAEHYLKARRDRQDGYALEGHEPGMITIAIADFSNNAIHHRDEFDPMTQGFAAEMIRHLNGATDLRVVERARLDWLLRELDLQRDANLIDPATAVQAGKLLGASTVLLGDFFILNDQLRLGVRFVSVETGEVLEAASVESTTGDLFDAVESLSVAIAEVIQRRLDADVEIDRKKMGELHDTESTDALLAYVQGRRLLEQGDQAEALAEFERALALDPDLERAQRQVDQVRPFFAADTSTQ